MEFVSLERAMKHVQAMANSSGREHHVYKRKRASPTYYVKVFEPTEPVPEDEVVGRALPLERQIRVEVRPTAIKGESLFQVWRVDDGEFPSTSVQLPHDLATMLARLTHQASLIKVP